MRKTLAKRVKTDAEKEREAEGWDSTRWWRAVGPDGTLLAETSNPGEFEAMDFPEGTVVEHMYQTIEYRWFREEVPE